MTTTPAPTPDYTDGTTTSPTVAVDDLVAFTTNAPWGEFTQIGRVVAVGTPEGADGPQAQVEWITVTGPIDVAVLEPYTPAV